MELQSDEKALCGRLGIAEGARRVLVFAETSHWDPNWMLTSEEYYDRRVRHTLDAALEELGKEKRRVFSIECVFFLRLYWERNPDRRDRLRALLNEGRLRLTGTGITTPDTIVPDAETILRDYLAGARWLHENGVEQRPAVAYLPDNFGNSPALPNLLRALGYPFASVSRIDGMSFIGDDYRLPGWYPRPGSSAKQLKDLGASDFVWRGPNGAEVVCHWNPFTYFQGDMLAHRGIIRWMNRVLGFSDRSAWHVEGKIDSFARRLRPLSPTRYLFCPIGCDFNDPLPDLLSLLDRYNERRFPRSGTFALLAGLDDYLRLVVASGVRLPVVDLDPNPYWMGFYSARPQLKQRVRRLGQALVEAEQRLTVEHEEVAGAPAAFDALKRGWEAFVVSNHHDFVTGTASDRVYRDEQSDMLREAEAHAAAAAAHAMPPAPLDRRKTPRPHHRCVGGLWTIETDFYQVELDARAGGCLTAWWPGGGKANFLEGPSNDLVLYKDTGGLWRMGHEFRGGTFRELDRASRRPAEVHVEAHGAALRVVVDCVLGGCPVRRQLWFRGDTPVVRLSGWGGAARRRTVTCRFETRLRPTELEMDVPGGVVRRALTRVYDPTFWCASNFVHARDAAGGEGLALVVGGAASVSAGPAGSLEFVLLRNAPRERAFGFLPVPAHPASGPNDEEHGSEYAVWFTAEGDWRANRLHAAFEHLLVAEPGTHERPERPSLPGSVITDHSDVRVRAVKPGDDGRGVVVRLVSYADEAQTVRLAFGPRPIARAVLCDALERDLADLSVEEGRAVVPVGAGAIVSARVLLASPA